MEIEFFSGDFEITNPGGNSTSAAAQMPLPSTTSPILAAASSGVVSVGDGVLDLGRGTTGPVRQQVVIVPYGVGTTAFTFSLNIFGWRRLSGLSGSTGQIGQKDLYIPVLLANITAIGLDSTVPGIANTKLGTTQFFCAAATITVGNSNYTTEVISPTAGKGIAHIVQQTKGFEFIEVRYFQSGASQATSFNGLWCLF